MSWNSFIHHTRQIWALLIPQVYFVVALKRGCLVQLHLFRCLAGVLVFADQYGLQRLITLCEIVLAKHVEKCTTDKIEKADIDVIRLLLFAQKHNANQLAEFCLNFIAKSYGPFSKRPEFALLVGSNKLYVEEHQWPPVSYWEALGKYNEKEREKTGSNNKKRSREKTSTSVRNRALRWFF
jgi:Rho family protein